MTEDSLECCPRLSGSRALNGVLSEEPFPAPSGKKLKGAAPLALRMEAGVPPQESQAPLRTKGIKGATALLAHGLSH